MTLSKAMLEALLPIVSSAIDGDDIDAEEADLQAAECIRVLEVVRQRVALRRRQALVAEVMPSES